jgi:arylsulfatase A-like enzyme
MGMRDGQYYYDTESDLMALYDENAIVPRPNVTNNAETRRKYHGYMAMISGVDRAVGRILAKLDQTGLAQNTLVVYTADHGDMLGSHNRPKPKNYPEQESCKVPLIMRFPGKLTAAQHSGQLISLLDMMPTLLGLMELPVPATCQGRNRAAAIKAGQDDGEESVPLYFFAPAWRGVYTKDFTYSFDETTGPFSPTTNRVLYDRRNDPHELVNLFSQHEYASLQSHLHSLTRQWVAEFQDPCPTSTALYQRCGINPEQLGLPGTEAILPGRPVDLLRGGTLETFLPRQTSTKVKMEAFL